MENGAHDLCYFPWSGHLELMPAKRIDLPKRGSVPNRVGAPDDLAASACVCQQGLKISTAAVHLRIEKGGGKDQIDQPAPQPFAQILMKCDVTRRVVFPR